MMNMNNDKVFVCDQCKYNLCDYKCSNNSHLNRHIKDVHLKLKDTKCNYNECKFTCSQKSHLKHHIKMVHLQIKDFICNYNSCDF